MKRWAFFWMTGGTVLAVLTLVAVLWGFYAHAAFFALVCLFWFGKSLVTELVDVLIILAKKRDDD